MLSKHVVDGPHRNSGSQRILTDLDTFLPVYNNQFILYNQFSVVTALLLEQFLHLNYFYSVGELGGAQFLSESSGP